MNKFLTYRSLLGCSALAMLLASAHCFPAGAQTAPATQNVQTFTFAVPQTSLANVLTEIGRVGKVTVSVPSDLVAGRTAGPVNGTETVESALNKALAGTGLVAQRQSDGGFVVRKQSAALSGDVPAVEVTAPKQRPVTVPTQQATAPLPAAPVANANGDVGFKAGDTGSLIGLQGVKIENSPLSITAVTKDVIQSQQVTDTRELARNVAGVVVTGNGGVVIRGFTSKDGSNVRIDGLRAEVLPNPEMLERVEVLKGATSVFTGTTADGGVVNFVKKVADGRQHNDLLVRYDSYFGATTSIDVGGKVKGIDGLSTRFVAVGTLDGLSSGNYKYGEVLGSVAYKNDAFSQSFSASYSSNYKPQRPYYYRVLDNNNVDIATARFKPGNVYGGSAWGDLVSTFTVEQKQSLELGRFAGTAVTIDHKTQAMKLGLTSRNVLVDNVINPANSYLASRNDSDQLVDKAGITFATKASDFNNSLRIGHDYTARWLVNVAPDPTRFGLLDKPDFQFGSRVAASSFVRGVSVADQLDLFKNTLHLFGSLRKDWWDLGTEGYTSTIIPGLPGFPPFIPAIPPQFLSRRTAFATDDSGISRNFGAGYDVTKWATVFYNYSNGVKPGELNVKASNFTPTQTFDQWDSGMRFRLFKDSLNVSVSYFESQRGNAVFTNAAQDSVVADLTSRGTEFQVQGAVTRNLQTNFALAITDVNYSKVASSQSAVVGGVAPVSGSLWNIYSFDEGSGLKGVSLGFGVRGNSSTRMIVSTLNNQISRTWDIPAYLLADASIGYKLDNWNLNLKATNIFDTLAFQPNNSLNTLIPEQARTITVEARTKF